jgi:hypothetical protein
MVLGIMGEWLSGKIRFDKKAKICKISLQNQYSSIPLFHYSIPGANSEATIKSDILMGLINFRDL